MLSAGGGVQWGKGGPVGEGGLAGGRGRGQGTFQSSCHILHYHVVLRPEGTSQTNVSLGSGEAC